MQTELFVHSIFKVISTVFGLILFYDSSPESLTLCHIFILFFVLFYCLSLVCTGFITNGSEI